MKIPLIAVAAFMLIASTAQAQSFVVVVNSKNGVREISRDQVARLFLKKSANWTNGGVVAPVDQAKDSKARELFTTTVLGRSVNSVESYWQIEIFAGKNAPPVIKRTDAEVVAFIEANPNAIGYVSAGTVLPQRVHAVAVTGG